MSTTQFHMTLPRYRVSPLATAAKKITGKRVDWREQWEALQSFKTIIVQDGDAGGLLHEIGHWVVAEDEERAWPNVFLDEWEAGSTYATDYSDSQAAVVSRTHADDTPNQWLARLHKRKRLRHLRFPKWVAHPDHEAGCDRLGTAGGEVQEIREVECVFFCVVAWFYAVQHFDGRKLDFMLLDDLRASYEVNNLPATVVYEIPEVFTPALTARVLERIASVGEGFDALTRALANLLSQKRLEDCARGREGRLTYVEQTDVLPNFPEVRDIGGVPFTTAKHPIYARI